MIYEEMWPTYMEKWGSTMSPQMRKCSSVVKLLRGCTPWPEISHEIYVNIKDFKISQLSDISRDFRYNEISLMISQKSLDMLRYLLTYFQISLKISAYIAHTLRYLVIYLQCWRISFDLLLDIFWHNLNYPITIKISRSNQEALRYLKRFKIS